MTQISVILVEDDIDLSDITADHLRFRGVSVHQVYTGIEFYTAVSQKPYDIAIIDLGLPDQPGNVLIEYAAKNTSMAIVVVSAYDQLEKRVACYEDGADSFLAKPVDPDELFAVIQSLFKKLPARQSIKSIKELPEVAQVVRDRDTNWSLDMLKRVLATPTGDVVELNHNEFKFCYHLAQARGEIVPRAEMLQEIYYRDDESAQRALDTLVRRLRQKITEIHKDFNPIQTTYGLGHSFAAPLVCIR